MNFIEIDIKAIITPGEEFTEAVATFADIEHDHVFNVSAHGRNSYRAAAFAMRDIADMILDKYPAFPEVENV